ncbi:serine O-acetyltransferase [Taklimakanibacter deserti]|uniref:serine O-acetyltransferase n=1 Tax=Taklimakanibacter deserti TaxID=2267839 RepID=UPI000E652396
MARQSTHPQSVVSLDPVWERIRDEAQEAARKDPSLGGFIFGAVLNQPRFEDAVMHRLSQRMANALPAELIQQAFQDALDADPSIGDAMRADIVAVHDRDPACNRYLEPLLYFKGFQAIQTHRMAHQLWKMDRRDFAYYLQSRSSVVYTVDIHPAARIGRGIFIDHAHGIVIGETAVVEDNVSLMQEVTLGGTGKETGDRHPKIRHGVLIGSGAKILGNIEIGHCSRVAAGSVVLHDVPPNRTVAGVPAKVVGYAGCEEPSRVMDHQLKSDVPAGSE